MSTAAGAKPRSEAQQIIGQLLDAGMDRAEIAKQSGVTAETIRHITRGNTSGDKQLPVLRQLLKFAPRQIGTAAATRIVPFAPVATSTTSPGGSPGGSPNGNVSTAPAVAGDGQSPTAAISPAVDVQEAPQEPERTIGQKIGDGLKDAILGKGQPLVSAKQAKAGGAGASNDELVEQLVPTLALGLVILSHAITPAAYVACDPTHAEAVAMLTPIVRIMTRTMDAAGKLTETQMDLLQCLMAVGMYGQRAFTTYREIRANDESHEHAQTPQAAHTRRDTGQSSQPARAADAQQRGQLASVPQHPASVSANGANGSRATAEHPSQAEVGKSNPFADLYQLDAIGRRQLGIG